LQGRGSSRRIVDYCASANKNAISVDNGSRRMSIRSTRIESLRRATRRRWLPERLESSDQAALPSRFGQPRNRKVNSAATIVMYRLPSSRQLGCLVSIRRIMRLYLLRGLPATSNTPLQLPITTPQRAQYISELLKPGIGVLPSDDAQRRTAAPVCARLDCSMILMDSIRK
jgi:hypothetical protein